MSTSRYANAGKRGARDADDDDEERVVYYDLDAGSRRNSLLLYSPENPKQNVHSAASKDHPSTLNRSSSNFQQKKGLTAVSAAADRKCGATSNASGIFERPKEIFHQQPLFHLDGSGGEDDQESEDENPFASLLQPSRKQGPIEQREVSEQEHEEDQDVLPVSSSESLLAMTVRHEPAAQKKPANSVLRKSTPPVRVTPPRHPGAVASESQDSNSAPTDSAVRRPAKAVSSSAKQLSFEAADARPSRWSQKSTMAKKVNRRKSVGNPLQPQKRQTEPVPRRSSLPTSLMRSQDEESSDAPKKRRLTDVLLRATLLSQQKAATEELPAVPSGSNEPLAVDNDDAIADTEHQMREEKFETQFFSPTKPNAASRKKHKPDAAATRIRGDIGAAINKAIRKSNRDLTMLRSHGQTLLQQSKDAHGGGRAGLDNVQDRHHVVVCLRRHRPHASQTIYDGSVNAVSSEINAPS